MEWLSQNWYWIILAYLLLSVYAIQRGNEQQDPIKDTNNDLQLQQEEKKRIKNVLNIFPDAIALHDISLTTTNGTIRIDHLLLTRYGVFVINSYPFYGTIEGNDTSTHWTCELDDEKVIAFVNPITQNNHCINELSSFLFLSRKNFYNIVVVPDPVKLQYNGTNTVLLNSELLTSIENECTCEILSSYRLSYMERKLRRFCLKREAKEGHAILLHKIRQKN